MELISDYFIDEKNFIGLFDIDLNNYGENIDNIINYWSKNVDNILVKKDNLNIENIEVYTPPFEKENHQKRKDDQIYLSLIDSPSFYDTNEFYVGGSHMKFYNAITSKCMKMYEEVFPSLNDIKWAQYNIKLQITSPAGGFHNWHFENSGLEVSKRVLTTMMYLNDDYDNGETEFLYQGIRIQPKKGRFCIFPGSFTHTHRGNPPANGTKWILTSWIEML